jgi:peptidyl-prolyl cis-trans isomerase C
MVMMAMAMFLMTRVTRTTRVTIDRARHPQPSAAGGTRRGRSGVKAGVKAWPCGVGLCLLLTAAGCGGDKSSAPKTSAANPAAANSSASVDKYGLTPEQAKQVLVKVGSTTITLGEFADRLGNQSPYLRARYHSPERRREFLDNMVRFELLASEAEKRGFMQSEEVERVRKQVMVQQMMQDLFDKGGLKLADVGDDEIKAYYDAHPAEFDKPAQVRVSHILYKDKASAEKDLKELQQKPGDMELFRKLAGEHNQDAATKDTHGDLRFFSEKIDKDGETDEPTRPAAVRAAAFKLTKVGDVCPEVVQSEQGFHIIKLTGRREPLKRSLDDARRMIQNKLWRSKREEAIEKFVSDLRAKANVKEDPEALAKVQVKDGSGAVGMSKPTKPTKPGAATKPDASGKAAHAGTDSPAATQKK